MTTKKRAGGLAAAVARSTGRTARPVATDDRSAVATEQRQRQPSDDMPVKRPRRATTDDAPRLIKYTVELDDDTIDARDDLARKARRALGRNIDKSEVIRALLLLAHDDASIRDSLIDELRKREPNR